MPCEASLTPCPAFNQFWFSLCSVPCCAWGLLQSDSSYQQNNSPRGRINGIPYHVLESDHLHRAEMKNSTFFFESSQWWHAARGRRWLWLPGMLSSFVPELSESAHRDGSVGSTALPAQLATVCCLHSWDGESQVVQGLSWKLGDDLGSQWGLGEFDLWSKSKHAFTASIICISCLNYLVGLSLCTRREWVILLPKKRARKYVYYILIS